MTLPICLNYPLAVLPELLPRGWLREVMLNCVSPLVRHSLHVLNLHEGIGHVSPKNGRKSPMSNAAIVSGLTRSAAHALVERAERQTGSRMAAYAQVAQTVGTSAEWLRKFIRGNEAKTPNWTVGWNLLDQYNRICARVEQELETERSRTQALKRDIDAATSPVARMVEGAARTKAIRAVGEGEE